jgi:hypothetical protein
METLEDDAFPMGETVSNIGEVNTRVARVHRQVSPCLHAEAMATMLV